MKLSDIQQRFILHWGEKATKFGFNRTVSQIHALLYLSPRPLQAEEIAETLSVARSNVSNSLRELQGWGIVRVVHVLGDRRDHFASMADVWEMFRVIIEERKRREIDPTLVLLRACLAESGKGKSEDRHSRQKISEMLAFLESMAGCYDEVRGLPTTALVQFVKMGGKVKKLLGL